MRLLFIPFLLLLVSCSAPENRADQYKSGFASTEAALPPGLKLMQQQCNHCHSPTAGETSGRIAPPMIAVKAHYLEKYPERSAFIDAIKRFTEKPSIENALLENAVKRFGLMPYQKYSEESIEAIAAYLYDYKIE